MEIRPLQESSHFHQAEELQKQTWGCSERDILPAHLLQVAAFNGSCVLGGFLKENMVAFVYGFPGQQGDERYLYSHLAAVHPLQQRRGYGQQLKGAQAQWARVHGFLRVVWTFDPLQTVSAYLNIAKLGATSRRYLLDYYGELDDDLNRGLPTDRLEVDWWLDGRPKPAPSRAISIPLPLEQRLEQRLRQRLELRRQFQEALAEGLTVCGFELRAGEALYWLGK